ncbi:MAG: TonB-dependent receptor, partial [Gammaproteobacteria bacterium]
GGRYTEDKTSPVFTGYGLTRTPRIPDPSDPSGMTPLSWGNSETFTDFSPRLAVNWQAADDMLAYGTISKGYKAGGFSLGYNSAGGAPNMGIVNEKYNEEELWNYEIGFKSEWMENRLRFNTALFLLQWDDFQYETLFFTVPGDPTSIINLTKNIQEAEAWGAEFEFAAAVTERFTINAALGYLDTEIKSDDTARLSGNLIVDLKGEPLPRSPEWTWNASADYFWPMGDNEAFVRLEWIFRDESFSTIEDVTYLQTSNAQILDGGGNVVAVVPDRSDGYPFIAPDHHVFNLRAGFDLGDQWGFKVWIENLADEDYFTGAGDNFGLSGFRLKPHPRSYGGSVTFRFGK